MIRKILVDWKGYVCLLEHLDLSLNALKPTEVADIVESLRDNSRLKSLNLNSTCVFGEVWSKLSLDPDIISDFLAAIVLKTPNGAARKAKMSLMNCFTR